MRQPRFNGADYLHDRDSSRLSKQHDRIKTLMSDGRWRTLAEIEASTDAPAASVSAQLRHLRKPRFGSYSVHKRLRGGLPGLYEYRVEAPEVDGQLNLLGGLE